ncbi:MAG: sulfite exporter TauE/SafE family protein [Bacteroidales bacterium]
MDLSPGMWILSVLCAIMIGMAKTGITGVGTLVVPLMAYIFGGMPSSGLVLPMLVMADIFGVSYYHRSADWKTLLKVIPWALAGIITGLLVGKSISAEQFKHMIGILVILSLIVMIWQEIYKSKNGDLLPHKPWFAIPFGIIGGFSTMIGNAAGPIMSVYLLSMNLQKKEFIGTAAWFFFIVNVFKMPLQIWGWHNITLKTIGFNFMLLPAIAFGAFAGIKIVKLIPESAYRWFVVIATFVSAIALFF